MFKRCLYVLLLSFLVVTSLQSATVKLTTYAEANMLLVQDGNEKWVINPEASNPKNFFELKFDVNMGKEFSLWMKANANTENSGDNLDFAMADLHAKYLKNLAGDRGFEVVAFVDEDSHFYLNQPLLGFTDNGGAWINNSGSVGFYYNGWNVLGLDFTRAFLVSSGVGDAEEFKLGAGVRVRKDFFKGGLKIGATGAVFTERTSYNTNTTATNYSYFQEGFDVDTSLLGPFSLVYEMGFVHLPVHMKTDEIPFSFKGELRGNFSLFGGNLGQTGFLASVFYVGENYSSWRGNEVDGHGSDRLIERFEMYYNFPLKAIYLKENLVYSHKLSDGSKSHLWQYEYDKFNSDNLFESYTELYIEFLNGFKFKSYYKYVEGNNYGGGNFGQWKNLFFQLEVENEFAKIKPMVLFLNLGDADASATIYGAEVLINFSDKIKFYSRFAMVAGSKSTEYYASIDGKNRNWSTFFCELQFLKVFSSTDIYLTFGDGSHTDNDIVHDIDNGIVSGRELDKKFNLSVKFWL